MPETSSPSPSPLPAPFSVPRISRPITEPEVIALHRSLMRLRENCEKVIETPEQKQQIREDLQFVSATLVGHAEEFVSCWGVVRSEYEPLIRALAIPVARAQASLRPHLPDSDSQPQTPQAA